MNNIIKTLVFVMTLALVLVAFTGCDLEQEINNKKCELYGHTIEIIGEKLATCTEDGHSAGAICSVCGYVERNCFILEAKGHDEVVIAGKKPTCTEAGTTDAVECNRCHEILEEATEVAATGHTFGEADELGTKICSECQVAGVTTGLGMGAALKAKHDVLLLNDIVIDPAVESNAYGITGINVDYGQTIDGNNFTLTVNGANGTWDTGINTTGGLIKNITVTGSFRGIFINHTSDHSEMVVLENVTITGTVYTISVDQAVGQGLKAINCTINGWTSFAATLGNAEFVNCTFGIGDYKFARPYAPTTFTNCTFAEGFDGVDCTKTTGIVFDGCKLGDADLTADNAADLIIGTATLNGVECHVHNFVEGSCACGESETVDQ